MWTIESHTGTEESFIENGADHRYHYHTEDAVLSAITRIFTNSIRNQEHQSPIVRLKYVGD